MYYRALQISESSYGSEHPDVAERRPLLALLAAPPLPHQRTHDRRINAHTHCRLMIDGARHTLGVRQRSAAHA